MADMSYGQLKEAYLQSQSRCKELERKLENCEKRNENLAARLAKITTEYRNMRELIENKSIPLRERMTLYGACRVVERKQSREDGFTHVYRSDIADVTGQSESQVGDGLKSLQKQKVLDRKIEHRRDETTGRHEKVNLVALGYAAKHNPKAIDFQQENNWGGKREPNLCGCGCTERIVTRRVVCKGCGTVLEETVKTLGENDLELETDEVAF